MQIETADVSLIGHREENQDRVSVAAGENAVFLAVIDGMGGHAEGARVGRRSADEEAVHQRALHLGRSSALVRAAGCLRRGADVLQAA